MQLVHSGWFEINYQQSTIQKNILGFFRPYDYGVTANRQKYGNRVPPSYNLKKVTAPVALYYGANDWLAGLVVSQVQINKVIK